MIADYVTLQNVTFLLGISCLVYYAQVRFREHRAIQRLGGYAPHSAGYLPFCDLRPKYPSLTGADRYTAIDLYTYNLTDKHLSDISDLWLVKDCPQPLPEQQLSVLLIPSEQIL